MRKFECKQCEPTIPCVIEWGDVPAPVRCPCNGAKVAWREVKVESKLPKLTVEALAERGIAWPEWCKVGAWVYSAALRTEFARITGPGKTSETLSAVTAEGFKCIVLVDKQAISCGATKPARVRPWTFGEAPESVKTAENSEYLECCWHLNGIFKGEPSFFCWKDNFISASKMAETMTQLDGSPCGVLEVVE